jgi:hypothetical protein
MKLDNSILKHANPPHSHEITVVRAVSVGALAKVALPMAAPILQGDLSVSTIVGVGLTLFAVYVAVKGVLSELYTHLIPHL